MSGSLKLLIIRFSSIGDIVLTTPVVRVLKTQLSAEIHYLTKPAYATILSANPYIDRIHTLANEADTTLAGLTTEGFDAVIDLHKNLRSARVKFALGVKSFTFNKLNLEKWLLVNLKIDRLPAIHIVDRYMAAVHGLNAKNDLEGLDYFIPKEAIVNIEEEFGLAAGRYIALVVGAAHKTKRLPAEKIRSLCQMMPFPVVLLGGPAEAAEGKALASQGKRIYNACGRYNINQSASIVQQAGVVISPDTGLMHVAAAFGKPLVVIWGNTIPGFGMYPYYKNGVNEAINLEIKGLGCRPCSKIGFERCPKKHFNCINLISDQVILDAVLGLWPK